MSKNLKVLIWAINESKELMIQSCSHLLNTAKLFNIHYELIGIGTVFKEHKQRIWILRDFLRKIDKNEIILCMDGTDTLFTQSSDIIVGKFEQANTRILFSAEKNYSHQYFHYKPIYDQLNSNYRYLNAGTFIGYAGDILKMLEEILEINTVHPNANDQGLMGVWVSRYLDQPPKVKLDINCNIFWVTPGDWKVLRDVSINHNYILNPHTHSRPSVIHVTGVGFPPHQQAYQAAYNLIMSNPPQKSKKPLLILLSAIPSIVDNALWKEHHAKKEILYPVWYLDKHPYISLILYNTDLPDQDQYLSTSYSYEAILRLLKQRHFDYIVHVSNKLMIDVELLYDTVTTDYQFTSEHGSEYPKSEQFIYHKGLYFSLNAPFLSHANSYEENQSLTLKNHTYHFQKRMKSLEEKNLKIEHEVIYLGDDLSLAKNKEKLSLFTGTYSIPIDCFSLSYMYAVINSPDFNESLPSSNSNYTEPTTDIILSKIRNRIKSPQPILFTYCVTENHLKDAIQDLIILMKNVKIKFSRNDRLVIVVPNLGVGTIKLQMLDYNIMVWAADNLEIPDESGSISTIKSLEKIIEYAHDESNWKYDDPQLKYPPNIFKPFEK